jgi:hypothetical protein
LSPRCGRTPTRNRLAIRNCVDSGANFSSSSKRVLLVEPTPWSFVHSVSLSCLVVLSRFCLRRAVVFAHVVPLSLFCFDLVRLEKSCSVRRWSGFSGPLSGLERREVSVLGCDPWRGEPIDCADSWPLDGDCERAVVWISLFASKNLPSISTRGLPRGTRPLCQRGGCFRITLDFI